MVTYTVYLLLNCQLLLHSQWWPLSAARFLSLTQPHTHTKEQCYFYNREYELIDGRPISGMQCFHVTFEYRLSLLGTSTKVIPPKGWGNIHNGKRGEKSKLSKHTMWWNKGNARAQVASFSWETSHGLKKQLWITGVVCWKGPEETNR